MIFYVFLLLLLLGSTLVFYSISPYYAAFGLVICAMFGCMVLSFCGMSFLALVLFLVYLGGMLMVFIYASALSAERYPMFNKLGEVGGLLVLLLVWAFLIFEDFLAQSLGSGLMGTLDLVSLGELYSKGGLFVIIGGMVLFMVLIIALVQSFESSSMTLRAL